MFIVLQIALLEGFLEWMLLLTAVHASMYFGDITMGGLELGGEIKIFLPL